MTNSKAETLTNLWYYITVFVLITLSVKYAVPLILPFIIAGIVAVLIKNPINIISQKVKLKRELIAFVAIIFITAAIISLLILLIYSIYAYLSDLVIKLPEYLPKLNILVAQITSVFGKITDRMPPAITNALSELPSSLISTLTATLTKALANTAKSFPSLLISIGVTVFASFLITRDYYKLGKFLDAIIPKSIMSKLIRYKDIAGNKSFGMIKGYTALTLITYIILIIGLFLLKTPYAPAVAAIIAFIDFLPILGTGIVLIPWAAIEIFSGNFLTAIGLTIIYTVATLARNILSPKILGNQIKLDSLTVLISMYVGYGAFGITGMIFAPFAAAILRDILME